MRFLIFAIGSAGDVHPFIGLGRALGARGHEVVLATSAPFGDLVTRAGLAFHELGSLEDHDRLQRHPHLWHPRKALPMLIREAVDPSYPAILKIARAHHLPGRTAIIAGSLAFGAMNPAELLDIPWITVHLAPSLFMSDHRAPAIEGAPFGPGAPRLAKHAQWWLAGKIVDHHILPGLNAFRESHGMPPVRDMLRRTWHSPRRVIGLFPDWFAPPQPDWPPQTRLTGFPLFDESEFHELPRDLDRFLDDGTPPLVFTPGSAMIHGHAFFAAAVESLRSLGRRGIFLTPYTDSIPDRLPSGIRHFPYIPLSRLLPRCAALVYHGGIGTCSQTLRAGIPHFIQHLAHDQLDNLSRVRDLGVGDGIARRHFTPTRITPILDRLTGDPAIQIRAREIANRFDAPTWIEDTCQLVEESAAN